jgi:hypothetical protein
MSLLKAYEEVVNFIAAETNPGKLLTFRPSAEAKERVEDLIAREKTTGLSPDETSELDHYLRLEHIMRLAKARARGRLATNPT